jgi:4-amino-4-deoxy-L-arabinose transferase-like glycosyltransferase
MSQSATPNLAILDPAQPVASRKWSLPAAIILVAIVAALAVFTNLGGARVLTRHEVLAAEPAREMTQFPSFQMFMLPKLAGAYRTAKPPGMMWLIAISITAFGEASALAARFPSGLACVASAVLVTAFAARWFDIAVATLAGLFQATILITQLQGRLCEADATLGAVVLIAIGALALACVPSPRGRMSTCWTSTLFYMAIAASILLKGLIAPALMLLAIAFYWLVRRDRRILQFLLNFKGIAIVLCTSLGWAAIAYTIDPAIIHDWFSEQIGTATGTFGSDPWYFYFHSVLFDLLPWTPFVFVAFFMGIPRRPVRRGLPPPAPSASAKPAPASPLPILEYAWPDTPPQPNLLVRFWRWVKPADPITQFLACWFVPGIIFLSAIKHKHGHYPIPILPPLIIASAAGMVHFVRWQRRMPPRILITIAWTIVCLAAGAVGARWTLHWSKLPTAALQKDMAIVVGVIAAGCILAGLLDYFRWHIAQIACIIVCVLVVEISIQYTVIPALDDYRPQAELALRAAAEVPGSKTIFLLGRREEEHEAQYTFYLRQPMQRCDEFAFFPKLAALNRPPFYAITPAILIPDLRSRWKVTLLDTASPIRSGETEDDHLNLVRLDPIAASRQ